MLVHAHTHSHTKAFHNSIHRNFDRNTFCRKYRLRWRGAMADIHHSNDDSERSHHTAKGNVDSSFFCRRYLRGNMLSSLGYMEKSLLSALTDNIQINRVTLNWLRRDLTVVAAGITLLDPLYLQRPLVGRSVMCGLEA